MLPFPVYLAARYIRPKRSFVSLVSTIAMVGVVLGTFILIVVLSVMSGFDNMWRDKILSFKPHLTIYHADGVIRDDVALCKELDEVPGISGVAPVITTLCLMKHEGRIVAPMVLGVDPERAKRVSRVSESVVHGRFDLSYGKFVGGGDLIASVGAYIGDTCLLYSSQHALKADETHLPEEVELAGVFDMGMRDYDSRFVLTSLDTARDLTGLDSGCQSIYVMLDDPFAFEEMSETLAEALGHEYRIRTWRQEDSVLFAALSNEKSMMFVLLVFISIVAAFCIACVLIVVTVHKTNEIGLMKALGFDGGAVMGVFVLYGMFHSIVGTAIGVGLGALASAHLDAIGGFLGRFNVEIFPKAIYGLSEIPAETRLEDVITVVVCVQVLTLIASVLSSLRAAAIPPAEALRHE